MNNPKKTTPFTPEKYAVMQQKVAKLESLREEVMERLIVAREMGDLSENGAYKYAKFELGSIGRQLRQLRHLLLIGYPVAKTKTSNQVEFGSTVILEKKEDASQRTVVVVSKHESNPAKGFIAFSSPIGKEIMQKSAGETVIITTPRGQVSYIIRSVS